MIKVKTDDGLTFEAETEADLRMIMSVIRNSEVKTAQSQKPIPGKDSYIDLYNAASTGKAIKIIDALIIKPEGMTINDLNSATGLKGGELGGAMGSITKKSVKLGFGDDDIMYYHDGKYFLNEKARLEFEAMKHA